MAISKIILNGVTQMDVTGDTVASNNLLSGETATGADGNPVVGAYVPSQPTIESLSVTPSETQQTFNSSSVDGYKPVTVGAISSSYVGSGITRRSSSDMTASGATVTAPAGYYESASSKTVASGTEGTPTATKGTVSNHSVTVTPSVTNTTGYITGSTKTGTGVQVTASELVSGNLPITANGNNIDVTNYSTVSVNVPSSSGMNKQIFLGNGSRTANSYGTFNPSVTLTVAETGTYTISWTAWRGSSSGTMGTNLYVNDSSGTNQQTWTGTYGQRIQLTNQRLNKNDVLTLYGTSGSNSRTVYAANLYIEQTA